MGLAKWAIIGVVGLYLAALSFVYFTQRTFMYFPPQAPIPSNYSKKNEVRIIAVNVPDIGKVQSIFGEPPSDMAPVILFIHGNGSAAYQYVEHFEAFKSWGIGYLAVEFPGYAANPGMPNEYDILSAALANYDELVAMGIAPERIVIYGDSLGAACAVHITSKRDAAGLILSAPFLSMQAMAKKQMPWFPTSLLLKDKYRSDLKMPEVTVPLLLLHGDDDELIPHTQGKALYKLHQGKKQFILIKGGQHYMWNTEMPDHIKEAVERFTNQSLP